MKAKQDFVVAYSPWLNGSVERINRDVLQYLITGNESNVHASRLKFFPESDLEVTEELREHVSAQGVILKVEAIREHRWNPDMRDFELLMSWEGLKPIEDSWEPMKVMHEDIGQLPYHCVNVFSSGTRYNRVNGALRVILCIFSIDEYCYS
ncbi:hypothetical protein F441_01423 [Phytophthora nicotianae CJ01A1]|uniref:Chromo domain-containing protein n=1 Tax=Phytophthora nicotianae CJ01A1 TaxID=1317063 RepID=W2XSA5_PHYNI|nr:hypothetical protein F441_01423 [Phytophthora nicotianae CJ01A1]